MLTSMPFKLLIRKEHVRKGSDILRFRGKLNNKDKDELLMQLFTVSWYANWPELKTIHLIELINNQCWDFIVHCYYTQHKKITSTHAHLLGPGEPSRYSDWATAGQPRIWGSIPGRGERETFCLLQSVPTGSRAHPVPCTMGTWGCFRVGISAGAWSWQLASI
jgi:hypothetical protein